MSGWSQDEVKRIASQAVEDLKITIAESYTQVTDGQSVKEILTTLEELCTDGKALTSSHGIRS